MKFKVIKTEVFTRVEVYESTEMDTDDLTFGEDEDPTDELDVLRAIERVQSMNEIDCDSLVREKEVPQEIEFDIVFVDE